MVIAGTDRHTWAIQIEGRKGVPQKVKQKDESNVFAASDPQEGLWGVFPEWHNTPPSHHVHTHPDWDGLVQGTGKIYLLSPSGSPGPFHASSAETGLLWMIAWPVTTLCCLVDYDAVLTEAGDYTEKYFKLRRLFRSVLGTQKFEGWLSS